MAYVELASGAQTIQAGSGLTFRLGSSRPACERFGRGRARFTPVAHQAPAEIPDHDYPLVLTTGRLLEHYHAGSMTRRVKALDWLVAEAVVEVHPADATRLGIPAGARVRVRSRRGAITTRAQLTAGITPGTVFMPLHFAEAAANLLTHAALDPVARIPEYKVCAVAIEAATDTSRPRRPQHAVGPAALLRTRRFTTSGDRSADRQQSGPQSVQRP